MQNKIFIFIGALVVVIVVFFGISNSNKRAQAPTVSDIAPITAEDGTPPKAVATNPIVETPKSSTETASTVKKSAWAVFQQYLAFAKVHNFVGLKSVAHQTSDTCNDPIKTTECNDLMTGVYDIGIKFVEKDFSIVWFDSKQIILSTDFQTESGDTTRSLVRKIIYFTRDSKGVPKVLSFSTPDEVTYAVINKSEPIATSTIDARLEFRIKDSDQDGAPDEVETCSYQGAPSDCIKTDPNKRDSIGDGWWDGIRALIRK